MKILRVLICLATCLVASAAGAVDYPTRPIRLVVAFAPGNATDAVARLLAQDMSVTLGQPVVVENRTGGTGNVATEFVRRAEPDGYTLLFTAQTHITNPLLLKAAQYDPLKDFSPISRVVVLPMVLVAGGDTKWRTVQDLVDAAKASPGTITYATAGIGGAGHLNSEMLAQSSHTQMLHVPFKGSAPALTEVMAGRVAFQFAPIAGIAQQAAAGRVKILAIGAAQRSPELPDVPTMAEAGFKGFDESTPWLGMLAPKNTPPAVVDKINQAVRKSLADPGMQDKLRGLGAQPVGGSPADFSAFLSNDVHRWTQVISEAGLHAE